MCVCVENKAVDCSLWYQHVCVSILKNWLDFRLSMLDLKLSVKKAKKKF